MKNTAVAAFAIILVAFATAFHSVTFHDPALRPVRFASAGSYGTVLAQYGGSHYVRAGEFLGRSENQAPTANTAALTPFVCQHDLVVERLDVWGQVSGSYAATVYMAPRASYTSPPAYAATSMTVYVPNTSNVGDTEENPVYCHKGDFLLVHINADVNPEYLTVFARVGHWNP